MDRVIRPLDGVGALRFGLPNSEVRNLVGGEFRSFKRSPSADQPCDYFPSSGVFAYYKSDGTLEAVELASPAQPILDGVDLFSIGFDAAKAQLQARDLGLEVESDCVISHVLGISLYAPTAKENPQIPCESVLVFERGYYG